MAVPLSSRQRSLASQLLQKNTAISRLPPVGAGLPAMASLLSSRQSSLASQLLQKNIAICPSPCGSGLARDGVAAVFKAELAGKPAPTEKHRNHPLPLWERACPRWRRCWLQGRARWQASSYKKTSQSAPPPVGAGLPAMASLLSSRQSSLASQRLQKNIAICPSPCGSGLARDGSAAGFKAGLAGKPAPTEKHRNLPPPPVGAGLPAMAAPLSSRQSSLASQRLQKNTAISHSPCGSGLARHIGDEPLTLCVNCSRSR